MNKIISIIIATWNAAKTLRNCLDSIVPQLTEETELLVIDGGSTDETMDIVRFYGDKISYSVSEKDKGIYDAWNKGIKVAKGDWIAFIGADDMLLPDAIGIYLRTITSIKNICTYDYICAHNEYVDKNGLRIKIFGGSAEWGVMRIGMACAHVGSLHNKKRLFDTIGRYNLSFSICADYELLVRKRERLKTIQIDATIARMRLGGMSFSMKAIKETYNIRKLHHTIPSTYNLFLYMRSILLYKAFIIRKALMGYKLI